MISSTISWGNSIAMLTEGIDKPEDVDWSQGYSVQTLDGYRWEPGIAKRKHTPFDLTMSFR